MTYVVTEPCIKCKYMDCVEICPVLCFHEGENFLVIDPEECIDCGACVEPCPVGAIYPEEEVPEKWAQYIEINARYAAVWPTIEDKGTPPPDADDYRGRGGKGPLLSPNPAR